MKKGITFLATGFYSGFSPVAPGTAGTIAAAIFFYFLGFIFHNALWLSGILFLVTTLLGMWISDVYAKVSGNEDPQEVVIDEWAGYFLTYFLVLFFVANSFVLMIMVFLLFRMMDITKPFPIYHSQKLSGGLGIMIDDLLAAVYAAIVVIFLGRWI